ncbi:MAG TPA: hypothetical protein VHN14_14595 [Kofleriaceae bacterium]|nr:hypothetical protein [Kofleriaceae bacterium]
MAIVLLLTPLAAHADPVVLAVEGSEIYIELGAKDGVGAGSELELLHEVAVKDPRTGVTLRDHFALGTLTVARTGNQLSVAHASDDLAKRVLAGDRVRLISPRRVFVDPWVEQVAASKGAEREAPQVPVPHGAAKDEIDHTELVTRAWQDTLGQSPEQRIARWTELLRADPRTPFQPAIDNEIASLGRQIAARDTALARARSTASEDRDPRIAQLAAALTGSPEDGASPIALAAPTHAAPDRSIELSFLVRRPAAATRGWLYVRPSGAQGFHRVELRPDGDAYLRATIERDLVRGAQLQWYVEAAGAAPAELKPVLGSHDAPRVISIDPIIGEAPIQHGRSHIDAHVDYVDFDGKLNQGFDQYYQAEIDLTYRFIDPVYAVRLGFGTLSGTGGPKAVIDKDPDHCIDSGGKYACQHIAFTYVYTEVEYRIRPSVVIMLRPQAGVLSTDPLPMEDEGRCSTANVAGCAFKTGLGLRGRLRFGSEDETNLVLGAAFSRGVGTLLETAYHWLPARTVPVQLTVQVTDQPVIEDFGVRLIGDLGWRGLAWFYPSVRLSYQARNINHTGISGGLALNFDW